jgi:phosphate transport system ATP-binding protein
MTGPAAAVRSSAEFPAAERGSIQATNFSFWYGPKRALFDITLAVEPRTITALIGPSGCGKSTFLRSINRMNDLLPGIRHEGLITLDGRDIHGETWDATGLRRRVGMVFQRWNPFPKSVFDNVAFGPRVNGVTDRKQLEGIVEDALKRAALWEEVRDRLRESALGLSGGQQQRLCIARALANNPEVLLLDEPASALDPIATQAIEQLMLDLKSEYTFVIVTHNMQQAARVADMTAFFSISRGDEGERFGELIEYDATAKIFTAPSDRRTEDYVTGRFG